MASSTTSNASNNLVARELLSIASSFVKQYYTLLNKAPCYIYNFYSNDSTFIHGTIETANEHYTEPIVGRERIRRKMEDLKLNDCRAKIKQIDCLETLAGGLVIQVIGELSNDGRPMRRFLQTFVLAPSPDEARMDSDPQGLRAGPTDRRGVNLSDNNASSSSQKFFVLNSIFRYQDDGPENEFENDIANVQATNLSEVDGGDRVTKEGPQKPALDDVHADGSESGAAAHVNVQNILASTDSTKDSASVERVTRDFERVTKLNRSQADQEPKQPDTAASSKVVVNGTSKMIDKKSETSEKPTENGNVADSNGLNPSVVSPAATTVTAARTQPTNEPKTWANMVRNHPPTSSIQANPSKPLVSEQPQLNQQTSQAHQQQPPLVNSQTNNISNSNNSTNNLGNNRRRHMMRKPANRATGRSIKNRQPRPPVQPHQQQPPHQGKPSV